MSKLKVSNEIYFLGAIAVIAFLFCVYNLVNAFHNSKWAQLTYKVNGKQYVSQKSIQVPFSSEIGSTVQLRYDTQHPERLYSFTPARILISLGITAVCIIAIVFRLI